MKQSKVIIVLCFMALLCSFLIACGSTKTDSEVIGTEADAVIVDKESATYEERTDVFLVSNNAYGQDYVDGNLIDMNTFKPKGGRVVTESEVNIYNQRKECIGYIKSGVTVKRTTESNEWVYATVTDGSFFVKTSDLKDLTVVYGNQVNTENSDDSLKMDEDHTYIVRDMTKTMYAKQSVNVRTGPSSDYERIGSLTTNQEVLITGQADTGWYRINYNGGIAFVSNNYLSDTKVEIKIPSNNGGNTNENENNSGGEYIPPTNENIYVPIEPTPTPEPTYTYTVDEVISIVRSTMESNGIMWYPDVFPNSEAGPSGGMSWGLCEVPMNDPYTYVNGMVEGSLYNGFNLYYIEYLYTENGCVVLKTYYGDLPK